MLVANAFFFPSNVAVATTNLRNITDLPEMLINHVRQSLL
jgi:hypothetical protein